MLVIGLTGGIGTGKTEVSRLLEQLGATVINADQVGHEAYTPHSEAWQEVVRTFGEDILQENGEIDRRKLGGIVFADPEQLATLNGIMHPRMAAIVKEKLESLANQGTDVAVVEAAVLFEAGWDALVGEVWTTESQAERVVERLQQRNGFAPEEIRKRIASQMPAEDRARRADEVIANDGELEDLETAVREVWKRRVEGRIERT
ncbi:MAG: dephospho-CoA kinase [Chloroflexota bacterium]|nr:dephospho-CoA kinase [Chloroflexota bacterium]